MNRDRLDAERGLYEKFRIERIDGRSGPGKKHEHCDYFVLDLNHDPHAFPALEAYASSCAGEFPVLARDLMRRVRAEKAGAVRNVPAGPHRHMDALFMGGRWVKRRDIK
jgi:hypothetical protein